MRTKIITPILFFFSLLYSCSHIEELPSPVSTPGQVAIVLPSFDRQVTYSIANSNENGSESDLVYLYIFNAQGELYNFTQGDRSSNTFTVDISTLSGTGSLAVLTGPSDILLDAAGIDDISSLENYVSETAAVLTIPSFVMSNKRTDASLTIPISAETSTINVELKRRVARIDVKLGGKPSSFPFKIKSVKIEDIQKKAWILDKLGAPSDDKTESVVLLDEMVDQDYDNSGIKSFYANPTVTGEGARITVTTENVENSIENTWQIDQNINIEANKRYTILCSYDEYGLNIHIEEQDWLEVATVGSKIK